MLQGRNSQGFENILLDWLSVELINSCTLRGAGDSNALFTTFMQRTVNLTGAGLGPGLRSQRYAAIVEDGVIKALNVEEVPSDLKVSDGDSILKLL